MVYRLTAPWTATQAQVEAALQEAHFVECGASQEKSVGWVEPRGQAHGACVEVVAGQWILKWMMEVKSVPGSVVKRKVQEQVAQIETATGRKPGKKEIRTLSDDARLALLPMAFTQQGSVTLSDRPDGPAVGTGRGQPIQGRRSADQSGQGGRRPGF